MDSITGTQDLSEAEQIIFVTAISGSATGVLDFYEMREGEWITVFSQIPVQLGRSGLIEKNKKREGDGFTPKGIYPIKRIFGKKDLSVKKLEYTKIKKNHYWGSNPNSKHYNQFLTKKEEGSISLFNSKIYELFVVVEYNTYPAIPGFGSMIFIHGWEETKPTSGCVGIDPKILNSILRHLDGNKRPVLFILSNP
ncbi:L,D-transpeptidase family protein [Leptospira sp. 96542]|nr:L,D-transpeptidase family protein [Leptospira sp. 96542]